MLKTRGVLRFWKTHSESRLNKLVELLFSDFERLVSYLVILFSCGLWVSQHPFWAVLYFQTSPRFWVLPFVPLIAFFNRRFQRLGDLAAGTLVVYAKPRVDPMEAGMSPAPSVPLALSLSREEESALLSFRYRSASWSASRQVELANHLAKMTGEIGPKGVQRALGMANWIEEQR